MIWQKLEKPITILAPMEDVTDSVFRQIILDLCRPSLFFTEFTNVDGMMSVGKKIVSQRLKFTKNEKPLIAQVWGLHPKNFYKAAREIEKMGFDGIDINMGCPQHKITSKGACAALINNHSLAKEIIDATKKGAGRLPVSVKTRLGFQQNQREEWISFLLEQNLPAITIHGRTAKEMSAVPAHWDEIGKVVQMRDTLSPETIIIGNGDIVSLQDGFEKVGLYKVDGIMVGRGIFHNPWMFDPKKTTVSLEERLHLLQKHTDLFVATWGDTKPFQILKKYFKIYIQGFPQAAEMRDILMKTNTKEEVDSTVSLLLTTYATH